MTPRSVRRIAWWRRAALLPAASFCIVDLIFEKWFWAGINGFVVVVLGYIGERSYWRLKHEYRRAAGNRNYPGASTGPLARTSPSGAFTTFETSTRSSIAHSTADLPIIAYKAADLIIIRDRPSLRSHFTGAAYDGSDRAECRSSGGRSRHVGLAAPVLDCSCGFYAVNTFDQIRRAYGDSLGTVLLQVELFGRVIVCEYGYRAERQRILHVGLPLCFYSQISSRRCGEESEFLVATWGNNWQNHTWDYLLPVCQKHRDDLFNEHSTNLHGADGNVLDITQPLVSFTPEDISAVLHVPVGPAREGF